MNGKIEVGDNLSKENFWDKIEVEYPKSMEKFNEWMNIYKDKVKWKTFMFKSKFHDIPFELQFGVLVQFMFEQRMGDGMMFDFDFNETQAIQVKSFAKKIEYAFSKWEIKL